MANKINNEIGQRIRKVRVDKNVTQQEMGEAFKITQSNYGRMEKDDNRITAPDLIKIAQLLSVSPLYLLYGHEERACKVCKCTELDCSQCIKKTGRPCHWVAELLCSACQGMVLPVTVQCNFRDGKGYTQALSFDTDLTMGCNEVKQLEDACKKALEHHSFMDYRITGVTYEIIRDGSKKI